jgi:hypothetical protein
VYSEHIRDRKPLAMLVVLAAGISLCLPALSSAGTYTATASLSDRTVSVGHPALASVDFHSSFASIDAVCFNFTFTGDLLDSGDFLVVTPLELLPSLTGPGFFNPGLEPQSTRTLCLYNAFGYESFTSVFLDGSADRIEIGMESGSVTIADLQIIILGTKTIAGQLADLLVAVKGIGPGRSLADKVRDTQTHFANSDLPETCSTLAAFINEVKAQSGKTIPAAIAHQLIAAATQIRTLLGC